MGNAFTVALVGFAQHESATFESFFRLAARRPPGYLVQDEVIDAQLLIVNADNAQALHLVRYAELPGRVLLIGQSDGGTGWPLQRKPVRLVSVLAELDRIAGLVRTVPGPMKAPAAPATAFAATQPYDGSLAQALDASMRRVGSTGRQPAAVAPLQPAPAHHRRSSDTEFPSTRPMRRETVAAAAPVPAAAAKAPPPLKPVAKPGVMRLTDFGGLDELPGSAPRPVSRSPVSRAARSTRSRGKDAALPELPHGDTLLVVESLVEGRILFKRLRRYGLAIDWSRESSQAMVMLQKHAYRLVVIDRLSGNPDAYQVCRAAKQRKLPNGQSPTVMMFAPAAGSMDRIKAGLAGSDAYLSRSVSEADLYKVLAQHRLVSQGGFEPTNVGF